MSFYMFHPEAAPHRNFHQSYVFEYKTIDRLCDAVCIRESRGISRFYLARSDKVCRRLYVHTTTVGLDAGRGCPGDQIFVNEISSQWFTKRIGNNQMQHC